MKEQNKNTTFRKFLRFSGIGIQLGLLMWIASKFGGRIDAYYQFEKPWITLLFILVALVIFVFNLMRQLSKINKE